MALGLVGSIRSLLRFIYNIVNIVNTLRALPLRVCEILFHKFPLKLILLSITKTFENVVPRPVRPRLKHISIAFEKSILKFLSW